MHSCTDGADVAPYNALVDRLNHAMRLCAGGQARIGMLGKSRAFTHDITQSREIDHALQRLSHWVGRRCLARNNHASGRTSAWCNKGTAQHSANETTTANIRPHQAQRNSGTCSLVFAAPNQPGSGTIKAHSRSTTSGSGSAKTLSGNLGEQVDAEGISWRLPDKSLALE